MVATSYIVEREKMGHLLPVVTVEANTLKEAYELLGGDIGPETTITFVLSEIEKNEMWEEDPKGPSSIDYPEGSRLFRLKSAKNSSAGIVFPPPGRSSPDSVFSFNEADPKVAFHIFKAPLIKSKNLS